MAIFSIIWIFVSLISVSQQQQTASPISTRCNLVGAGNKVCYTCSMIGICQANGSAVPNGEVCVGELVCDDNLNSMYVTPQYGKCETFGPEDSSCAGCKAVPPPKCDNDVNNPDALVICGNPTPDPCSPGMKDLATCMCLSSTTLSSSTSSSSTTTLQITNTTTASPNATTISPNETTPTASPNGTTTTASPNETTTTASPNATTTTASPNATTTTASPNATTISPNETTTTASPNITTTSSNAATTTSSNVPTSNNTSAQNTTTNSPTTTSSTQTTTRTTTSTSALPSKCTDSCPYRDDPLDPCKKFFFCDTSGVDLPATCPGVLCFNQTACKCL